MLLKELFEICYNFCSLFSPVYSVDFRGKGGCHNIMFMIDQYIGGGQVRKYWSMSFIVNQITTPRVSFLTIVLSYIPPIRGRKIGSWAPVCNSDSL